jgi:hypothetical protein
MKFCEGCHSCETPCGKEDKMNSWTRYRKAVQHLAEEGHIKNEPHDIGGIIKEVGDDILKDSKDEIKEMLFQWAWPWIKRSTTKDIPSWYKKYINR